MSSPLHRDPDIDGANYGCLGKHKDDGNRAIALFVNAICASVEAGEILGHQIAYAVQEELTRINSEYRCGATDTIVKENVRNAIAPVAEEHGLEVDWMEIYGW